MLVCAVNLLFGLTASFGLYETLSLFFLCILVTLCRSSMVAWSHLYCCYNESTDLHFCAFYVRIHFSLVFVGPTHLTFVSSASVHYRPELTQLHKTCFRKDGPCKYSVRYRRLTGTSCQTDSGSSITGGGHLFFQAPGVHPPCG